MLASWDLVFRSGSGSGGFRIRCEDVTIHVRDGLALLTCVEVVDTPTAKGRRVSSRNASGHGATNALYARLACTNVFECQDGVWRIIHHHAHSL